MKIRAHTVFWVWNKDTQQYTNRCGYRTFRMAQHASRVKFKDNDTQIHKQVGFDYPAGRPVFEAMWSNP